MNANRRYRICRLMAALLLFAGSSIFAADNPATKVDPRYPFRTDFANANLPWYQPRAGEFPPHHSDRRIGGELVSADFIHRTGQFRMSKNGELVNFTMPPYASVNYLNTDADLRDVPLGTFFLFFLNEDGSGKGNFTRLATMQDQFTMDAGHGFSYRLDEIKLAGGKLLTSKHKVARGEPDLGKKELIITPRTRIWKEGKLVKPSDLAAGDELLFNFTGKTAADPGHCTDIWIGADSHKLAADQQRAKFSAFLKYRGLPGWIDHIDGEKITATLFTGDPDKFKQTWLGEFAIGKEIKAVVANEELRTWNPGVDNERGVLLEIKKTGVDAYGTSGVQMVFTVSHMLEGFRKGRVIRLFGPGWKLKDQFYGESLMGYGYGQPKDRELLETLPKEYPSQFPYRTDYGNETLPWFQLKAGEAPPRYSEHVVFGDLVKVDAAKHTGQFRTEQTGALVDFSLITDESSEPANAKHAPAKNLPPAERAAASIRYLNADAELTDLPLGMRYRFHLFQDEKGAFTRVHLISDEFSHLSETAVLYRIEGMMLSEGKLHVALQIPEVKNYNGDMEQPPDIGRTELLFTADTRIWKGHDQVKPHDLAIGDLLLVNRTSEQAAAPSHCTDIWVGAETQQLVSEAQAKKHQAEMKKH